MNMLLVNRGVAIILPGWYPHQAEKNLSSGDRLYDLQQEEGKQNLTSGGKSREFLIHFIYLLRGNEIQFTKYDYCKQFVNCLMSLLLYILYVACLYILLYSKIPNLFFKAVEGQESYVLPREKFKR